MYSTHTDKLTMEVLLMETRHTNASRYKLYISIHKFKYPPYKCVFVGVQHHSIVSQHHYHSWWTLQGSFRQCSCGDKKVQNSLSPIPKLSLSIQQQAIFKWYWPGGIRYTLKIKMLKILLHNYIHVYLLFQKKELKNFLRITVLTFLKLPSLQNFIWLRITWLTF